MTNRSSLYLLLGLALLLWVGLLLFTRFVPPQTLLTFVAFFLLLTLALLSTLAPISYALGRRIFASKRRHRVTLRYALRQGALLSLAIVLNMILRALHSWNIGMAIVIVLAAGIVEVLFLARK